MPTRSQLLILTIMATLGGSFAGLLVVGLLAGDVTLAVINLGVILALFSSAFVIGSGSGEKPAKKRAGEQHIGGEVLPEFQADLLESVRQMKAGKAARTHKASV